MIILLRKDVGPAVGRFLAGIYKGSFKGSIRVPLRDLYGFGV